MCNLLISKLKYEVGRKARAISFYRLHQNLGRNTVEFSKIFIEHDLVPANRMDAISKLKCGSHGPHASFNAFASGHVDEFADF